MKKTQTQIENCTQIDNLNFGIKHVHGRSTHLQKHWLSHTDEPTIKYPQCKW